MDNEELGPIGKAVQAPELCPTHLSRGMVLLQPAPVIALESPPAIVAMQGCKFDCKGPCGNVLCIPEVT